MKTLILLVAGVILGGACHLRHPMEFSIWTPVLIVLALYFERRSVVLTLSESVTLKLSPADPFLYSAMLVSPNASGSFLAILALLEGINWVPSTFRDAAFRSRLCTGTALLLADLGGLSLTGQIGVTVAFLLVSWGFFGYLKLSKLQFGSDPGSEHYFLAGIAKLQLAQAALMGAFVFEPRISLLVAPLLHFHPLVINGLLHQYSLTETLLAREGLEASQRELESARGQIALRESQLQEIAAEKAILNGISETIAGESEPLVTLDLFLATLGQLATAQNYVVFTPDASGQAGVLVPLRFRSQNPERLQAAPLLRLQEPCALDCFNSQAVVKLEQASNPQRLLPNDRFVVAFPMGSFGVTYLGRASQQFSDSECRKVAFVVESASKALQHSLRVADQKNRFELELERSRELAIKLHFLNALVGALGGLSRKLDFASLEVAVADCCAKMIPANLGIWFHPQELNSDEHPVRRWGDFSAPINLERLAYLHQQSQNPQACQVRLIEFEEQLANARIPRLLICNLRSESNHYGILALGFTDSQRWNPALADLCQILAEQFSVVMHNVELFTEIAKVRRELEKRHLQLMHSNRVAAIGELAAGVAHELNSPLAATSLAIESVQCMLSSPSKSVEALLDQALQGIERSKIIVQRVLSQSAMGKGEQTPLDLKIQIEETARFLGPQLERRGYKLELNLQPSRPVLGNPPEFSQLLTNLVMNAADASPKGSKILLSCEQQKNLTVCKVRDWGSGMDEQTLAQIFEPFFTTKENGKGTGLGLSVSQSIVEGMGGRLKVDSLVGQGTQFSIQLPSL